MSEKELLTVKEVADYAGVSVQAVYNRLEKDFKPYLKIEKGKKRLNKEVLQLFETEKNSSDFKENFKPILNLLEKQNEQLQRELDIKNKQIEELNLRLAEAHKMAEQAQQLHGADKALELKEAQEPKLLEEQKPKKRGLFFWK